MLYAISRCAISNDIYPAAVKGLTWSVVKTPAFNTIPQKCSSGDEVRIAQQQNPLWSWKLIYEYLYDYYRSPQNTMAYSPATDLRELMGFFLQHKAMFDDFLFDDPSDDWIGAFTWKARTDFNPGTTIIDSAGHAQTTTYGGLSGSTIPTFNHAGGTTGDGSITWQDAGLFDGTTAQAVPLVTDGVDWYSPIQRNMGGLFLEDITDLNLSVNPLRAWANGTLRAQGAGNACDSSGHYRILGPGLAIPGYSFGGMYIKWCAEPTGPITIACNFYFRVRFLSDQQDFEQFMAELWTIGGSGGKNGSGTLELTSARPPLV